jgi:hypothetical protein
VAGQERRPPELEAARQGAPFRESGWDRGQAAGGLALVDAAWEGSAALQSYNGRYWMSYLGSAKEGYEPDPLTVGVAWTKTPHRPRPWTRLAENPVLTPDQPDVHYLSLR